MLSSIIFLLRVSDIPDDFLHRHIEPILKLHVIIDGLVRIHQPKSKLEILDAHSRSIIGFKTVEV